MALRVWLPLNGNLNNQGLGPQPKLDGVATYGNGKIGQARLTGGAKFTAAQSSEIFNDNGFTYCAWIYVQGEEGEAIKSPNCFFGRDGTPRIFAIFQYPKVDDLHLSWTQFNDDKSSPIYKAGGTWNDFFNVKTWVHLAITYKTGKITIYKNGVQYATTTGTPTWSTQPGGYEYETWALTNTPNAYFNDIRVYDECLSQKQIKEIAKGLVCHYKMTMSTINENLLLESNSPNRRYNTASYPCGAYNLKIPIINSEQYTFSIKVTIEKAYKIGFYFGGGSYTPGWLTFPDSDGTFVMTQTFTANANQAAQSFVNVYVRDSQDKAAMGEARCTIHWIKLEKGSQVTSYVNDAFKQNEILLNDCSGYNYNLNQKGDLILNYDSLRYDNSTTFPGLNLNYLYRDKFDWLTAPFTFNCWCNQISRTAEAGTSTTTLQFVESQGRDCGYAGFSLCVANGKPRLYLGTSTSETYWGINSNEDIELNTWHMLTGTYDGTIAKLYVDGVLKASQNSEAPISWEQANGFTIGKMAYSHTSTQNYFPFNGSISDVRIYATALSAEEILTLYKNSGIIDNNGNVYTREFKEV